MNTPSAGRRVALITGGSRGIGAACATSLAARGLDVAISYADNVAAAGRTCREIESHGTRSAAYLSRFEDSAAPAALMQRVIAEFGRLDVLVCSAAIAPVTPLTDIMPEEWDRVIDVNLRAAFFCAQAALRQMIGQSGGRIIFISSQAGQAGGVFVGAHYVASKAGLLGLTKAFARNGAAHGVLVNCVSPGQIDTPLTSSFPPQKVAEMTRTIPMARMGSPEEVAAVVCFLASDEASYITGATIPVNGGFLMS